jgi:hypothetical protein
MSVEDIYIIGFMFIAVSIILGFRLMANRVTAASSYVSSKTKINWKKVFKYWVFIQIFCLIGNVEHIYNKLAFIILFPILIIYFILVYGFSTGFVNKIEIEDVEDYKEYEKKFIRDKKIKKIIR